MRLETLVLIISSSQNIILPYLSPGIIAGYFMAFTYSLDDFAVTFSSQEMALRRSQ